jgi:hypothetical protein
MKYIVKLVTCNIENNIRIFSYEQYKKLGLPLNVHAVQI